MAAGIGSISLLPSLDGVIRSIPLLVNIGGQIWPSLSLESLRLFNNEKNLLIEIDGKGIHTIKTRETFFLTDENGLLNIKFKKLDSNNKVSKVSIVGAGMITASGVTYKMFRALAQEKINILAISTSEIKLSVIINEINTTKAVKKLHTAFNLD